MTKEEFFEGCVNECFNEVHDDLKKVCEAIRTYNELEEEEFYQDLYDSCSDAHYSIISGFNMFTDSIDMETMLETDSDILDWGTINEMYQKATSDTRTLREAYNEILDESDVDISDFVEEVYSIISSGYGELSQEEQRSLTEAFVDYMISIYECLGAEVWYAPSEEEDDYGNTKYYIIASDYVWFDV